MRRDLCNYIYFGLNRGLLNAAGTVSFRHSLPFRRSSRSFPPPDRRAVFSVDPAHQAQDFMLYSNAARQDQLGHTTLTMVRRYAKIAELDVEKAHKTAGLMDNLKL
jgi:hypothetical protein